jgi:hypothetical protein
MWGACHINIKTFGQRWRAVLYDKHELNEERIRRICISLTALCVQALLPTFKSLLYQVHVKANEGFSGAFPKQMPTGRHYRLSIAPHRTEGLPPEDPPDQQQDSTPN